MAFLIDPPVSAVSLEGCNNSRLTKRPVHILSNFLLTFIFFNTFAINMFLKCKKVGKWKNYPYGEKAYIVLSLVSKSVLGWVIVLGTMGV